MATADHVDLEGFIAGVKRRNPGQDEFVQAVQEVAEDIFDFIQDKEQYHEYQILRRIAEPDRVVSFRVCWEDDKGAIRVQRGWRVLGHPGAPVPIPARQRALRSRICVSTRLTSHFGLVAAGGGDAQRRPRAAGIGADGVLNDADAANTCVSSKRPRPAPHVRGGYPH